MVIMFIVRATAVSDEEKKFNNVDPPAGNDSEATGEDRHVGEDDLFQPLHL